MNRFRHSPTGILQKCHLRNLETFHFEIPIANNLNLCQFLNKHPTLTDIRLGHTAGYYGHIDSETCPKLCLLPHLERLLAPDYYFYAFEKPISSLTDIEVWMAPSPHGAMMTLVKQHLKHLRKRYTGRDGDSVIVTQPVLDYIAGIAPSLKSLTIIHRPGYPGTTKYFSRPGIHVSIRGHCDLYIAVQVNLLFPTGYPGCRETTFSSQRTRKGRFHCVNPPVGPGTC